MPSFQDSAVIFFIALLLFGPKKLPELARYIGKLMAEFRRASSEFRNQMDDEFRQIEIAENQKKLDAMAAAAPPTPSIAPPVTTQPAPLEDYDNPPIPKPYYETAPESHLASAPEPVVEAVAEAEPLPIATSGDLSLMPPATGLPQARTAPQEIPQETETTTHG